MYRNVMNISNLKLLINDRYVENESENHLMYVYQHRSVSDGSRNIRKILFNFSELVKYGVTE